MIYFSYTNQKTGRVIEVSADTQSGGRSKFENAYRAVVDAKGDRKVNTLRSVAADDGGTVGDAVVSGPCASLSCWTADVSALSRAIGRPWLR
jgi:hypothetical protein